MKSCNSKPQAKTNKTKVSSTTDILPVAPSAGERRFSGSIVQLCRVWDQAARLFFTRLFLASQLAFTVCLMLQMLLSDQLHATLAQPPSNSSTMTQGQDRLSDPKWSFGYELFQMLLEERGLTLTDSVDSAISSPAESVIVMLGDLSSISQPEWLRLQRFATNGGTVLLASDQSMRRAGFNDGPVSTAIEEQQYQQFDDCVVVGDLSARSSLTRGLRSIVMNRSGWLTVPWSGTLNWFIAARLPANCEPRRASQQPVLLLGWPRQQGRMPNAADSTSRGAMILAADQSLFTNLMLWHGDNAMLAIRVSELLCNGNRRQLVFLVDRQSVSSYRESPAAQSPPDNNPAVQNRPVPKDLPNTELPEPEVPEPELATMLKLANKVVQEVEESNVVNEVLANRPRNVRQPFFQRSVMLLLAILAAFWLLWRLAQKNSIQTAVVGPRSMLSSLQMITKQTGSTKTPQSPYASAAEVLARDLCQRLTHSTSLEDWQSQLKAETQPNGSKKLPKSLRAELQFALELAVRGCSVHISRQRLEAFGKNIRELQSAWG